MDIEKFLSMLTPEQLEEMAKLKREESEQPIKQKRKQNRKPKKNTENKTGKPNKPRKKKLILSGEDHPNIPKNKKFARKYKIELGQRENKFENSPEFYADQHLIEEDKKLWTGRKPSPRSNSRTLFVEATCSRCRSVYEDVPSNECYKDDEGVKFVCEECVRGMTS